MIIRPSKALAENYDEIAETCRQTSEPVFITRNGARDTVMMDIDTYNRREQMLEIYKALQKVEAERKSGAADYTIDEWEAELDEIFSETV